MLRKILAAKRSQKRLISIIYDSIAIAISLYLAIALRLGTFDIDVDEKDLASFGVTLLISLLFFIRLGLYRAILRYAATDAALAVFAGAGISAIMLSSSSFFIGAGIPRSSPIIFFLTALVLLGLPRLFFRSLVNLLSDKENSDTGKTPIIIYGAGYSGYQLAAGLNTENSLYKAIAFVDDNPKLINNKLRGIDIYPAHQLEQLATEHNVNTVLLAMGKISRSQKSVIVQRLEKLHLKTLTIPAIGDIISGKSSINDIKPVAVEDLLGRDPVPPKLDLMHACITEKNILVTGAGGSIGSELCRNIIQQGPKQLVLFEISEYNLYTIERDLKELNPGNTVEILPILGSVQDIERLKRVMTAFQINTVYHAAAYKHVPVVEHNVIEGVQNNVLGTWYCAEAAIAAKVESFVLVSTDKAVRPTNIMGTTKRTAELVLQALTERQSGTRFTMVRFGNVLGSSGSVVPLFRKQIAQGGPITVTHPEITRYFMTIPEAAELVIQAGSMGQGGDVFVLDMGEPVKIVDLAKQMVHLSGLKTTDHADGAGDIEIEFTGLRPGEKLYEELLVGDNVTGTEHQLIMRAEEKYLPWKETLEILNSLENFCRQNEYLKVYEKLLSAPTDYQGNGKFEDYTWNKEAANSLNLIDISKAARK